MAQEDPTVIAGAEETTIGAEETTIEAEEEITAILKAILEGEVVVEGAVINQSSSRDHM